MRHIVIAEDGALQVREDGDPLAAVGPEGSARVGLHPSYGGVGAFVNDCGLVLPDRYCRNVTGSVLLATMGARIMPYAGPVVITNWCRTHEVEEISPDRLDSIRHNHDLVVAALAGQTPECQTDAWAQELREFAATVPTADAPIIQIIAGTWPEESGGAS